MSFIASSSRAALTLLFAACSTHSVATQPLPQSADFCPGTPDAFVLTGAPSTDLYCIELIATPSLMAQATGVAQLAPPPSPFGAAVTVDGHHRFRTTFFLNGLPAPATLGPYTTYVAWAAPPSMNAFTKLGVVRNGRTVTGELALNKYYMMISAEVADTVSERRGPLVLRGLSASTRMRDPHFMAMNAPEMTAHTQHGAWPMPPHDPRVPATAMGIEHLVPAVSPYLPADNDDIPRARPRELMRVADGDTITLRAQIVRRSIKGRDIVMYGFNGQYPGPLIQVTQASTIVVNFHNDTPHETAVHWHGVRLDNRFDGVPHITQEPVLAGGSFRYVVRFPDAGIYWYHPHHREDIQQDLGLYGNLLITPRDSGYYAPAHRDEVLMLDDLLLADNGLVPYGRERANFALMGRFGNVLLVNGEPRFTRTVARGEVVRYHLTNASNTRTFNVSFDNARMKLVASDVSRFAREEWVQSVVLAPAERYVVDVMFDRSGTSTLTNRVQAIDHMMGAFVPMVDTLGTVDVTNTIARPDLTQSFSQLRTNAAVAAEIERYREHFTRAPDLDLQLMLRTRNLPFELTQLLRLDTLYFNPVEWAGTMPMMDWLPTTEQVQWVMRDARTGAENDAIRASFRVGDVLRVRLRNERHTLHAMQHPIHIHGQRFLVLSVNGAPAENYAWKDTVLVPVGTSVELLLELTNPGRWMIHCHIAEHLEAGMSFIMDVR
jgi:suppressor of ftsI